jgi:rhamnose transport system substrate-binding protein
MREQIQSFAKSRSPSAPLILNYEWALLLLLLIEIIIFSFAASSFFTPANGSEIARQSVELGLLALALTAVIITGGIDLSVGSMLGLSAVIFGSLWRDWRLSVEAAALLTLLVGLIGGALNALLVIRLGLSPLIVTLGTYSLFRGVAEGLTSGIDNYNDFPARFLYLGQGYLWGLIPVQALILSGAVIIYWLLLHRTTLGRSLQAIGFSAEGARFAGVRVAKSVGLVYLLAGFASSLAAIIYVARLGQAKADAGLGYELIAITAVVLGGTSIFGGHGRVLGTILALSVVLILQNGLRQAALPAELAGILTGVLLIAAIGINRFHEWVKVHSHHLPGEEMAVKNSQIFALCACMLACAFIIAGSNWLLVRTQRQGWLDQRAASSQESATRAVTTSGRKPIIAMMPKAKGDPYFISCRKGAEEAARELGAELIWDGPTELDPAKQNEVVEGWIIKGVDVIAVSVENQAAISTVLRKARAKGIRVITWDADAHPDARDFLINQATPQGIGYTLADEAARVLGGRGEFAIITASLSASNQNEWIKHIKARLAEKYGDMKLVAIQPSDGDRDRAFTETQTILKVYPNIKLIVGIAAPAVPGAAEAVKQSGRADVKVIGLSLPNMSKPYVHAGIIDSIILWNTQDLGYLTVYTAYALGTGELKRGDASIRAGRLGAVEIQDDQVMLGAPYIFNKDNIDGFDF